MDKASVEFYKCIQEYLTCYLPGQRRMSRHTSRSYANALSLLVDYLKQSLGKPYDKLALSDITHESVCGYMSWLESERGCAAGTVNCRLAAVKSFIGFAAGTEIRCQGTLLSVRSVRKRKEAAPGPRFLSEEDLKLLLSLPDASARLGARDRLLLSVLYETAAREAEAAALRFGDFSDEQGSRCARLCGKGGKTRLVPVGADLMRMVASYCGQEGCGAGDHVFGVERKGARAPISASAIYKIVRAYGQRLREATGGRTPEKLHPHVLRHTRAMHWYLNGMQIEIVSMLLGHASLETTQIYARADLKMKAEAIAAASPGPLLPGDHEKSFWDDEERLRRLCGLR